MKQKMKIAMDLLMTILLFMLNGYQFYSESLHEWLGVMIFICFILHNALNFNWYKTIRKGRYSKVRIIYLIINFLVFICMLMQMYSGIVMSRHVFSFLNLHGSISFVRRMHILGAYWGFLLIGVHLGMHWNILIKHIGFNKIKQTKFLGILFAIYGIYAFIKRQFPTYLFLKSEFVFMDFNEFPLFFYIDYVAIMGLCIFITNYGMKFLLNKKMIENKSM